MAGVEDRDYEDRKQFSMKAVARTTRVFNAQQIIAPETSFQQLNEVL